MGGQKGAVGHGSRVPMVKSSVFEILESYSRGMNELASREVVSQLFENGTAAKAADPSDCF